MSNKKEVIAGTAAMVALAAAGSSASAADVGAPHDWSGFYAGVSAGGFMGALPNVQDTTSHYNLVTSITPGAFAGFNVQSGNIVWGAEADFQGIAMANSNSSARPYSLNNTLDAKARLGYATDQFLFYLNDSVAGSAFATWSQMSPDPVASLPPERFHFDVLVM